MADRQDDVDPDVQSFRSRGVGNMAKFFENQANAAASQPSSTPASPTFLSRKPSINTAALSVPPPPAPRQFRSATVGAAAAPKYSYAAVRSTAASTTAPSPPVPRPRDRPAPADPPRDAIPAEQKRLSVSRLSRFFDGNFDPAQPRGPSPPPLAVPPWAARSANGSQLPKSPSDGHISGMLSPTSASRNNVPTPRPPAPQAPPPRKPSKSQGMSGSLSADSLPRFRQPSLSAESTHSGSDVDPFSDRHVSEEALPMTGLVAPLEGSRLVHGSAIRSRFLADK
ncbi:hypothetical protein BDK51DRAFT_29117 [Blyttiomyces helicus]|uniref:Uncharacterized protein n=1 Tax=Blyttiomyces helicus TaxID=388810 RepID=A0A4V1IR10_9FUNG|nr:hypothetical protein BDK51DRAFT_29117 [Blyttiomyces helicus]|eukprot:RKO88427.1 hypothetical protein BDK51DRAFT_29117 [Blyttiomyces helicus]